MDIRINLQSDTFPALKGITSATWGGLWQFDAEIIMLV